MPDTLFITGASGLIGSRLLERLDPSGFEAVRLLVRGPLQLPPSLEASGRVELLRGDLRDPASWAPALGPGTIVVHAAAVTGSASAEELDAVNRDGVAALLQACRERGARRLLHLSSVAATYPELRDVPYGRSKLEAEQLIQASGLDFTIVRPSVVVDPQAPGFTNLVKLATAPAMLVPGDGRARLQPIDLDDVVEALLAIVTSRRFQGETLDLGGPEALSCEDFMQRIRLAAGAPGGPVVHLPLGALLPLLRGLERLWPGTPPVSAGQFAVFRFDGTSAADGPTAQLVPQRRGVDDMLRRALPEPTPPAERELEVFSRYLLGRAPDAYLRRKYLEGTARGELAATPEPFDALLLRLATLHPVATRAIDVFARFFHPTALVRKKLILALAIAECWAPSYLELDRADAGSALPFALGAGLRGLASAALLLPALLLLLPARAWLSRRGPPGEP